MSHSYPLDLRYTNDHEWLRSSAGRAQVGITTFAVEQLGDITLVDLPREGDLVTKGQRFGTIESVKSVSDLYAPISGKVVKVNAGLKDRPELVNESPYAEGWMIEIEPDGGGTAEIEELLTADGYADLVASQG
jgi:glycine cleavage system H protein